MRDGALFTLQGCAAILAAAATGAAVAKMAGMQNGKVLSPEAAPRLATI